jgi:DNA-binding transcriptional MocR family regulator
MRLPSERELCEQLGVSRTVGREAVHIRVTKGLLKSRQGIGAIVRGVTQDPVADAYPIPLKRVGIADRFAETGPNLALLDRYGMPIEPVLAAARAAVALKR